EGSSAVAVGGVLPVPGGGSGVVAWTAEVATSNHQEIIRHNRGAPPDRRSFATSGIGMATPTVYAHRRAAGQWTSHFAGKWFRARSAPISRVFPSGGPAAARARPCAGAGLKSATSRHP